ncbi:MAG TPA: hypothetical protein VFW06_04015 [Acidimicrobiia bacterium]|nr:hypothetical protein [Acidimicrobiia bacterium]
MKRRLHLQGLAVTAAFGIAVALAIGGAGRAASGPPFFERITVQGYTCSLDNVDDGTGTLVPGLVVNGSVLDEWDVPANSLWYYTIVETAPVSQPIGEGGNDYGTTGLSGSTVHSGGYEIPGLTTFPAVFRYDGAVYDAGWVGPPVSGTVLYQQSFTVTCTGDRKPAVIGPTTEKYPEPAEQPEPEVAGATHTPPTAVPAAPRTTG